MDYRALNQVNIRDQFPMPIIKELIDELRGTCISSKLDSQIRIPSNTYGRKRHFQNSFSRMTVTMNLWECHLS